VREVRRDHTATVIATGSGLSKDLLINGYPTTVLTDITKWLAHLPLASLDRPPERGLVICFGMGTTFRSMLAWGIPTTAVELVPSVPSLFGYYYADGPRLLQSPLARVVIDDGRRFLDRTTERYDVITIDPPNPIEAAGSSALYAREFYTAAKPRLSPSGIVSQWIPTGHADLATMASVARAIRQSFPHVRAIPIVKRTTTLDVLGVHFIASMTPFRSESSAVLASRVPPRAAEDLREWEPRWTVEQVFDYFLSSEMPIDAVIRLAPSAPVLEDDRPFNEYYFLRRWLLPRSSAASATSRR
jgi:spermidine synthase